jgi:hypothetical protein
MGKMAAKKATPAWKRHELVTKAIFEELLKLDGVKDLEIRHNVTIKGIVTSHQIDVYWKFAVISLERSTIVEVKKRKARASKADLLRFHRVMMDIPGPPEGIFVSQSGYQKGALEVARAHGIATFEIREIDKNAPPPHIVMTVFSTMAMSLTPDRMMLDGVIFIPTINRLNLTLDELWLGQHPEAMPANQHDEPSTGLHELRFLDEAGAERSNFRTLVQDRIREFREGGRVLLEVEFPEPTYVTGLSRTNNEGRTVGNLKILRLAATLDIKTSPVTIPRGTHIFKQAMSKDERYVMVTEDNAGIVARISAPLRGKNGS